MVIITELKRLKEGITFLLSDLFKKQCLFSYMYVCVYVDNWKTGTSCRTFLLQRVGQAGRLWTSTSSLQMNHSVKFWGCTGGRIIHVVSKLTFMLPCCAGCNIASYRCVNRHSKRELFQEMLGKQNTASSSCTFSYIYQQLQNQMGMVLSSEYWWNTSSQASSDGLLAKHGSYTEKTGWDCNLEAQAEQVSAIYCTRGGGIKLFQLKLRYKSITKVCWNWCVWNCA